MIVVVQMQYLLYGETKYINIFVLILIVILLGNLSLGPRQYRPL